VSEKRSATRALLLLLARLDSTRRTRARAAVCGIEPRSRAYLFARTWAWPTLPRVSPLRRLYKLLPGYRHTYLKRYVQSAVRLFIMFCEYMFRCYLFPFILLFSTSSMFELHVVVASIVIFNILELIMEIVPNYPTKDRFFGPLASFCVITYTQPNCCIRKRRSHKNTRREATSYIEHGKLYSKTIDSDSSIRPERNRVSYELCFENAL
jgi:hypothetical protein